MANESIFGPQVQIKKNEGQPEAIKAEIVAVPESGGAMVPRAPLPTLADLVEGYGHAKLTETQRKNLTKYTEDITETSVSQAPLVCRGTECPFRSNCPLFQNGVQLPIDKQCPVEQVAIAGWKRKFYESAAVPEDHPNKELIYLMIDDLVAHTVIQTRVFWQASQDGKIIKEECIGVNADGDPIYTTRLDPSLDYILRLGDRKQRLLRELLATPRSQIEAKRYTSNDPSTQAAKALAELAKLQGVKKIEGGFLRINLDGNG
jgi:hypothetical protein